MKSLTAADLAKIASGSTTFCMIFRLIRRDGVTFGFTDHDHDITIDGVTCSSFSGFVASALESSTGSEPDTQDIEGVMADGGDLISPSDVTRADMLGYLYDGARLEVALVDWQSPPATFDEDGYIRMKPWQLAGFSEDGWQFRGELVDLLSYLNVPYGDTLSQTCRVKDFGNTRCGVDLGPLTVTGSLTAVDGDSVVDCTALGQPDGYFDIGKLELTSGNMVGRKLTVSSQKGNRLTLLTPSPLKLTVGDTFSLVPDCDRANTTCAFKYNNIANFDGEAHNRGPDSYQAGIAGAENR